MPTCTSIGPAEGLDLCRFHQFESFFLPMSFIICIMSSDSLELYQAMAVAEFGRAVDAGHGKRSNVAGILHTCIPECSNR